MLHTEDEELLEMLKAGSEEAFKILYNKYYKSLYLIAREVLKNEHDAKDVVQTILIEIWLSRKTLKINVKLITYLATATRNECLTLIRQRGAQSNREQKYSTDQDTIYFPDAPTEEAKTKELIKRIEEALKLAPADKVESFRSFYEKNLSQEEIAMARGLSVSSIKKHIRYVRDLLISKLNRK
jgi:RNA polymerase sigma factor (sigma-70 family)